MAVVTNLGKFYIDKTVLTVYTVNIQLAGIAMRIFQKRGFLFFQPYIWNCFAG